MSYGPGVPSLRRALRPLRQGRHSEAMAEAFTPFLGEIGGIDPRMAELGDRGAIEQYESADFDAPVALGDQIVEQAPPAKPAKAS